MKSIFIVIGLFFINLFYIYGQQINKDDDRFLADSIKGVYIPRNLEECFTQIDKFWDDSTKLMVKSWTEDEFSGKAHFGFGMWMRNNWQLWGGSRLSKYFNDKGIFHPDDMSGIILKSYYRYLNNKEIKLDEQIKFYQEYWEKYKKEENEKKIIEFNEYKIGDTVLFKYPCGYSTPKQESDFDNDKCIAEGKILERDSTKFLVKIILLNGCSNKGIIFSNNQDSFIFDNKSKTWQHPKKKKIKYLKKGQQTWFYYDNWELK